MAPSFQSQIVSPRTPAIFHVSSPENATYSLILTSSENISRLRSQSSQDYTSLIQQITKRELFANKDLTNYCSGNDFSTLALDFDSTSDLSSEFLTQDSVVKKLSLNEEAWKQGTDDGKEDVTYSNNRTCEEELLRSIYVCDSKCRVLNNFYWTYHRFYQLQSLTGTIYISYVLPHKKYILHIHKTSVQI